MIDIANTVLNLKDMLKDLREKVIKAFGNEQSVHFTEINPKLLNVEGTTGPIIFHEILSRVPDKGFRRPKEMLTTIQDNSAERISRQHFTVEMAFTICSRSSNITTDATEVFETLMLFLNNYYHQQGLVGLSFIREDRQTTSKLWRDDIYLRVLVYEIKYAREYTEQDELLKNVHLAIDIPLEFNSEGEPIV